MSASTSSSEFPRPTLMTSGLSPSISPEPETDQDAAPIPSASPGTAPDSTNRPTPSRSPTQTSEKVAIQHLGAELAYIQDSEGHYQAFHWREAAAHNLDPGEICHTNPEAPLFGPVNPAEYLDILQRVLLQGLPERLTCRLAWGNQSRPFDLVLSPMLGEDGNTDRVLVMGRSMSIAGSDMIAPASLPSALDAHQKLLSKIATSIRRTLPLSSALYQILLTKIARNIRKTLDLDTIWQQTVCGLVQALSVCRAIVCTYPGPEEGKIRVVAEHTRAPNPRPMLGAELSVAPGTPMGEALTSLEPITVDRLVDDPFGNQSMVIVAARHQGKVNALIALYQYDRTRHWTTAEAELMRELADQVGTAIAHASLFAESQALTHELQEKNIRLIQKQQELEEAREQAEEVSRLKSEFLANTSHEIRTPLNGVIGFLKLIIDDMVDDPEEQQEFLTEAYNSAVHLLNILNDILDIARIEADRLELTLMPVNLSDLFQHAADFTVAQIQKKGLRYDAQLPDTHDDLIVYGDDQRLLQVMLNLIGNATKFTHEGGITVSADLIRQPVVVQNRELPGFVRVRVADTGIGVALDKQDRLFQSFSQVDGARTRRYGGTGLGLVISRRLVEAMGGDMNFYSLGEGLGSTVTFTVPLYQEPVMRSADGADRP